jgi:hypothetical protein
MSNGVPIIPLLPWTHACLQSRFVAATVVYLLVPQLLSGNGSTCNNMLLQPQHVSVTQDCLQGAYHTKWKQYICKIKSLKYPCHKFHITDIKMLYEILYIQIVKFPFNVVHPMETVLCERNM